MEGYWILTGSLVAVAAIATFVFTDLAARKRQKTTKNNDLGKQEDIMKRKAIRIKEKPVKVQEAEELEDMPMKTEDESQGEVNGQEAEIVQAIRLDNGRWQLTFMTIDENLELNLAGNCTIIQNE